MRNHWVTALYLKQTKNISKKIFYTLCYSWPLRDLPVKLGLFRIINNNLLQLFSRFHSKIAEIRIYCWLCKLIQAFDECVNSTWSHLGRNRKHGSDVYSIHFVPQYCVGHLHLLGSLISQIWFQLLTPPIHQLPNVQAFYDNYVTFLHYYYIILGHYIQMKFGWNILHGFEVTNNNCDSSITSI